MGESVSVPLLVFQYPLAVTRPCPKSSKAQLSTLWFTTPPRMPGGYGKLDVEGCRRCLPVRDAALTCVPPVPDNGRAERHYRRRSP
jgi:hypothetical protein